MFYCVFGWRGGAVVIVVAYIVCITSVAVGVTVDPSTVKRYTVRIPKHDAKVDDVLAKLRIPSNADPEGGLRVYLTETQYRRLSSAGVEMEVVNYKKHIIRPKLTKSLESYPSGFPNDPLTAWISHEDMEENLQWLQKKYPAITNLFSIGKSTEGRDIWVLQISKNPDEREIEPQVKLVAGIHGDEPVGRNTLQTFALWLCQKYGNLSYVTDLIDNTDIYILFSLNPDGYTAGTRENGVYQDLNRNFPDQFTNAVNTVNGRQPEVAAMMEWTASQKFILSISCHGGDLVCNYGWDGGPGGDSWNGWPYAGAYSKAPDDATMIFLCTKYADAHGRMAESGEFSGGITNGADWYTIYGGMQDWNYVWHDDIELTIEQDYDKTPDKSRLPTLFDENFPAYKMVVEHAHIGIKGTVVDAYTGEPLLASITVAGINKAVHTDPRNGGYWRLIVEGTYDVTVSATGYISQTATDVEVNYDPSQPFTEWATLLNFELEGVDPDPTYSPTPTKALTRPPTKSQSPSKTPPPRTATKPPSPSPSKTVSPTKLLPASTRYPSSSPSKIATAGKTQTRSVTAGKQSVGNAGVRSASPPRDSVTAYKTATKAKTSAGPEKSTEKQANANSMSTATKASGPTRSS